MKTKLFITALFLLIIPGLTSFAEGQTEGATEPDSQQEEADWDNPAERYADAYKQYLDAECPLSEDNIRHFVYLSRDREALQNHPILDIPRFDGAQIMYSWKQLEPEKGQYDFSEITEDYN